MPRGKKKKQSKDEERQSLDAAYAGWHRHEPDRVVFQWELRPRMALTLWLAGLTDAEIERARWWLGVPYSGGMSEECRAAKRVLESVPMLNEDGSMDPRQFWLLATEHPQSPIWQWRHYLDAHSEPNTEIGRIALKAIRFWRWYGEQHWPDGDDLAELVRIRSGSVSLSEVWDMAIMIRRAWHGRNVPVSLNPDDLYAETSEEKRPVVEVDAWASDGEFRSYLDEQGAYVCSDCGVRSLERYGWAISPQGSHCPKRNTRAPEDVVIGKEEPEQEVKDATQAEESKETEDSVTTEPVQIGLFQEV